MTQRTVAHLNWLRSQSAPLVPKNSREKGSSKDPEHGSAPALGSPRTGRRDHPALCKAASPPDTALGNTCWGVPSTETSFHKLTPPGERSGVTFSSRFGYLLPQALWCQVSDTQQPLNSLLTWESSFKKLSFKKLMCSQAVKLTKQKGHFPEQQEQFGAFPGSWKAGHAEHRLCRALSCAKFGHAALGAWAST